MGRPRKPASLKAGKSETKAHLDERNQIEVEMKGKDGKVDQVPDQLDDIGKTYYTFLVEELKVSGILSNLDIPTLTQTADCLSKMQQADEYIKREGIIYETFDKVGNTIPKEHPAVSIKLKYLSQFRALSTQLGLSPSSRASLSEMKIKAKEDDEDPVLQILKGFNQ